MDIWSKEKRSKVMARIKGRDTKPELIVRRYLYSRGYRYRKNVRGLPGTPDIVMRKYRVAIFVHGCFWHGHDADSRIPDSNREFWQAKIERNKARDRRDKERLISMGWSVITIWECQLKPSLRRQTLSGLEYYINHNFLRLHSLPGAVPSGKIRAASARPYAIGDSDTGLDVAAEGGVPYGEKIDEINGGEARRGSSYGDNRSAD